MEKLTVEKKFMDFLNTFTDKAPLSYIKSELEKGIDKRIGLECVSNSAFDEVRKLDNENLRSLLKEVKEIGRQDVPRQFKQSEKMRELFELEKSDYYTWSDKFSNVQRAIENEILWRIRTDAF